MVRFEPLPQRCFDVWLILRIFHHNCAGSSVKTMLRRRKSARSKVWLSKERRWLTSSKRDLAANLALSWHLYDRTL